MLRVAFALAAVLVSDPAASDPVATPRPGDPTTAPPTDPKTDPVAPRYGRDVRHIFSDRCFQCHGADSGARQADLRLDLPTEAHADRGGYAALVPGDAEASEVWRRLTTEDPDDAMPPADAKKRALTEEELDTLRRWIDAGAEYEEHWSFVPPARPAPPAPDDAAWVRNPIDAFVLANLEREDVAPSPDADRATLLRRVFLDLTGLPPTVEELDAFLADTRPGAYERVVDDLFGTEPYRTRMAERFATPWMDAARYGDTSGIHMDNGRQMWPWRDWVLAAFRDNMAYDRFVVEQIAGDLLPDATTDQIVASGFNRNHVITDEGGAINEEYLVEYAADRVVTTSSVFLGLTTGCARCHDHKFDPLSQAEFYGMMAFFNSIEEPGLYTQTDDPNRAYEPFIEVPSPAQLAELDALDEQHADLVLRLDEPLPGEEQRRAESIANAAARAGLDWSLPEVLAAWSSEDDVSLTTQDDGSILAGGRMPAFEDYTLELRSEADALRAILVEALRTPDIESQGAGRASHGNAVVTGIEVQARPSDGSAPWTEVPLIWAWSDHRQTNGDFEAGNVLDRTDTLGWAADGNANAGERNLLLLAEESFGFEGGTDLRITLAHRSVYSEHSLGRVRLRVSPMSGTSQLPVAAGRWYKAQPFRVEGGERDAAYDVAFGPETLTRVDARDTFGDGQPTWTFDAALADDRTVTLFDDPGAGYVGRTLWSPDARELEVSLGSDDGFQLYLNGELVAENRVDRGVAMDQDEATLPLRAGANALVYKLINTGGPGGYAFRPRPAEHVMVGELPSMLLPDEALSEVQQADLTLAWRRRFFEDWRALDDERVAVEAERATVSSSIPRSMVMQERDEPKPTYVLMRGQYDHPDESRPVDRRVPEFLPALPEDAPRDRLGLAQWLVADENPLFARVAVNRFWQILFAHGLVRTAEDFGHQGDWPSHPALLDWLAVEFRESGWDLHGLLRLMVTSHTYRQSSAARPDLASRDPDNRWLAAYPRRRLEAEQIRDLALSTSGLLIEVLGGPSVKPYQPEGLWQEVSMLNSNTRTFMRGEPDELWRRSLYTYWKRAVPPPSLQTFDAPTRESCVIRRSPTNTPLQALVLWNDVQFVEAARALAARALQLGGDIDADDDRLAWLLRACTSRTPDGDELALLGDALAAYRARYAEDLDAANALLEVGEAPVPMGAGRAELAAWTMLASAVLNLHETVTQD